MDVRHGGVFQEEHNISRIKSSSMFSLKKSQFVQVMFCTAKDIESDCLLTIKMLVFSAIFYGALTVNQANSMAVSRCSRTGTDIG